MLAYASMKRAATYGPVCERAVLGRVSKRKRAAAKKANPNQIDWVQEVSA